MLAQEVESALNDRGWSLRAAELYTGVPYTSVDRMKKGLGTESDNIIKFAIKVANKGEEVETALRFLELAGKGDMVQFIRDAQRVAASDVYEPLTSLEPDGRKIEIRASGRNTGITFEATPANLVVIESVFRAMAAVPDGEEPLSLQTVKHSGRRRIMSENTLDGIAGGLSSIEYVEDAEPGKPSIINDSPETAIPNRD